MTNEWALKNFNNVMRQKRDEHGMGKLILCHEIKAKNPFYIRCIEKNVYTIEELCYFFYNEIYFVEDFHDWGELAGWLKREMKMEELAAKLQRLVVGYDTKLQMIQLILEYSRYLSGEDLIEYENKVEQVHKSTGVMRQKKRADHLVRTGKYTQAVEKYNQIIQDEATVDSNILADVYHNLGVVHGYMYHFDKAAKYFLKSFSLVPSSESLKQYKLSLKLGEKEETDDEEILNLPSVQQLDSILQDEIQNIIDNEFSSKEPFYNLEEKKSEGKVSEYYGDIDGILRTWKEECRRYI